MCLWQKSEREYAPRTFKGRSPAPFTTVQHFRQPDQACLSRGGGEVLGVESSELIQETILGMREVAEEIGFKGTVE